jgi:hypothetical protein
MPPSDSNIGGASNNSGTKSTAMTPSDASRIQSSQVSLAGEMLDEGCMLTQGQGSRWEGHVFRRFRGACSRRCCQKCERGGYWWRVEWHRETITSEIGPYGFVVSSCSNTNPRPTISGLHQEAIAPSQQMMLQCTGASHAVPLTEDCAKFIL